MTKTERALFKIHIRGTFKFTHLNDPACTVIYELNKSEGGVDFKMTLEGLPVGTKTAKQMLKGGPMILNTLKAMVERGRPSLATRSFLVFYGGHLARAHSVRALVLRALNVRDDALGMLCS